MNKEEIKLLKFLFKQELACGIILNPALLGILEFDDCVIRWN
jgi:hypothetical protein